MIACRGVSKDATWSAKAGRAQIASTIHGLVFSYSAHYADAQKKCTKKMGRKIRYGRHKKV